MTQTEPTNRVVVVLVGVILKVKVIASETKIIQFAVCRVPQSVPQPKRK